MRYGDSAAVMKVAWLVIDKYRDAKAQTATTSATKPIAIWASFESSTLSFSISAQPLSVRRGASAQPQRHEQLALGRHGRRIRPSRDNSGSATWPPRSTSTAGAKAIPPSQKLPRITLR